MSAVAQLLAAMGGYFIKYDEVSVASGVATVTRTATVAGDFLLALMGTKTNATWTGDTGWTEDVDDGSTPSLRVAHKANGGGDTSAAFTNSSGTKNAEAAVLTFRGASYDTIGAVSDVAGTGDITPAAITVASAKSMLLMLCIAGVTGVTFTQPSGMFVLAQSSGGNLSWAVFWQPIGSGSTGATRTTNGGASGGNAAVLLSLGLT